MPKVLPLSGFRSECTPTVIVTGLPRSGTSMMMQMLAAGGLSIMTDGIRSADEDNPRGYYELEAVKKTKHDASWLEGSEGQVVKMVYSLITDLPTDRPFRVILMRRKTEVVLRSQAAMLQRLGQEGADLQPEKLAKLYEVQLEQIKDYLIQQPCFEFLEVWYGAILAYPESQIERLNGFLSGELDGTAMAQAVDPSLRRQQT